MRGSFSYFLSNEPSLKDLTRSIWPFGLILCISSSSMNIDWTYCRFFSCRNRLYSLHSTNSLLLRYWLLGCILSNLEVTLSCLCRVSHSTENHLGLLALEDFFLNFQFLSADLRGTFGLAVPTDLPAALTAASTKKLDRLSTAVSSNC